MSPVCGCLIERSDQQRLGRSASHWGHQRAGASPDGPPDHAQMGGLRKAFCLLAIRSRLTVARACNSNELQ
jgi:hypothetical protein